MPPDKAIHDYMRGFDLRVTFPASGGDVLVGLDPGAVDRDWWATRRHAYKVARRVEHMRSPSIVAAAADLGGALTEHHVAIARAQAAVERIDTVLAAAQAAGDLKFFNSQFRRRRVAAKAAGRRFMTYGAAVRGLRRVLAGAAADGAMIATLLEQVLGAGGVGHDQTKLVTRTAGPQPAPVPPPGAARSLTEPGRANQASCASARGLTGISSTVTTGLVRLDVGRPDHLSPLFRFGCDQLAEVRGRSRKQHAAQLGDIGPSFWDRRGRR